MCNDSDTVSIAKRGEGAMLPRREFEGERITGPRKSMLVEAQYDWDFSDLSEGEQN